MIEITNYTTNTAHEFTDSTDLEDYMEEHEGDEIGVSSCDIISISSLNEAIKFLYYTDEEREQLEVVASQCGHNYFTDLDEALTEFEELNFIRVDGADSLYQLAHKLNHEIHLEDELYMLLGCTVEAYQQLGSYISTDDIAHLIEREHDYVIAGNNAYLKL